MHFLLIPQGMKRINKNFHNHKNTMRYWCELIPADSFLGHYIKGIKKFWTDAVNILFLLNF